MCPVLSQDSGQSLGNVCKNARVDTLNLGPIIYSWRPYWLLVWFLSSLPLPFPEEWVFLKGLARADSHVPGPLWHPHPPDFNKVAWHKRSH